jgi:phosphoribosylformylglycinamidine synthase
MAELAITPELVDEHGITQSEYDRILAILGRTPTFSELGVFSVMWSEHCSYKSSRSHLAKFPTEAPWVIQGPGENAGIIDIGDGLACCFKMESHNHPSFIEPYQGAATGVGGILRDVFTMGARPVANLDSLRFGPLTDPLHRHLVRGVVAGIAGYGNCMGIPTVAGELWCGPSYQGNILVNVMTAGIVRHDRIFKGEAAGVGNPVMYVGAKTGRDGIHGATMASEEFTGDENQKRPTVQVGDPFTEKRLLEACLELMKTDWIVGIQDMGAAGLTSSGCEMASRSGTGVELDLDRVPQRETGMTAYEMLLSESQERMVLVARKGFEDQIRDLFHRWDLEAVVVGKVVADGMFRVRHHGEVVVEIPADAIAEEAPKYDRPFEVPVPDARLDLTAVPVPKDLGAVLLTLLASPNICHKGWVHRQYDHMVRTDTVVLPGSDAAVVRVKENGKALALTTDCNPRWCRLDPRLGAMHAVAEAARNVACSGARPLAITDCLNFGNPENPRMMGQFVAAVEGMAAACAALETPVVSGNVSLYNETHGKGVDPTPTVGMVGLLERVEDHLSQGFRQAGDGIYLVGEDRGDAGGEIGGSEYLSLVHGQEVGPIPVLDLAAEHRLHRLLERAAAERLIASAHDCSDGGLAVALAEAVLTANVAGLGAQVVLAGEGRADCLLFGESATRVVVSVAQEQAVGWEAMVGAADLSWQRLGEVTGDGRLHLRTAGADLDLSVKEMSAAWFGALAALLDR